MVTKHKYGKNEPTGMNEDMGRGKGEKNPSTKKINHKKNKKEKEIRK